MTDMFEQSRIKDMVLPNRFVRSATWEGMATEKGEVTAQLTGLMSRLARGRVGLIISGHAYVLPKGQAGPWQLGAYSDQLLPGLQDMARAVHSAGGRIVLQLAHSGCQAPVKLTGQEPAGPSALDKDKDGFACREMSTAEIEEVRDAFAAAALRARQAGFDGVQIHAAHGYMLSQFLSPYFNRRNDEYGGNLENRARLVLEVLRSIRKQVGPDYPVLIKINAQDFLQPGLSAEEMVKVCQILEAEGLDGVELSGGTPLSGDFIPVRKAKVRSKGENVFYVQEAQEYKKMISLPLILVGGIRSLSTARDLVERGVTDYVSMARPLIREPELIKRWEQGDERPSACTSDNLCFRPASSGEGVYCLTEVREKQKAGD
jgi:2,4-dienoyl-CoA reductase-like NADH-dependent reductase (Old Yellow Enzyme family)